MIAAPHMSVVGTKRTLNDLVVSRICSQNLRRGALSAFLLVAEPPINPPWSQAAGRAQTPSPIYILEPRYSPSSCSVVDDNWTPGEPAMPLHV